MDCLRAGAAQPSKTFTYGLGRAEDLAGILIVLIILFSALVAGYQAISRLLHPEPVQQLGWLAVAGIIGFIGNEAVAVFRIRVGRQINSAALVGFLTENCCGQGSAGVVCNPAVAGAGAIACKPAAA